MYICRYVQNLHIFLLCSINNKQYLCTSILFKFEIRAHILLNTKKLNKSITSPNVVIAVNVTKKQQHFLKL